MINSELGIYEFVYKKLSSYLPKPDVQVIVSELRSELIPYSSNLSSDASILACKNCEGVTSSPQLGKWNLTDPDILFVLPKPGTFSPAGSLFFSDSLKQAKFLSSRCGLVYANKCSTPQDKTFSTEEKDHCSNWLWSQIRKIQPKIVVLLSSDSAYSFLGFAPPTLADVAYKITFFDIWPYIILPSPEYFVHNKSMEHKFHSALADIKEFCYGVD